MPDAAALDTPAAAAGYVTVPVCHVLFCTVLLASLQGRAGSVVRRSVMLTFPHSLDGLF